MLIASSTMRSLTSRHNKAPDASVSVSPSCRPALSQSSCKGRGANRSRAHITSFIFTLLQLYYIMWFQFAKIRIFAIIWAYMPVYLTFFYCFLPLAGHSRLSGCIYRMACRQWQAIAVRAVAQFVAHGPLRPNRACLCVPFALRPTGMGGIALQNDPFQALRRPVLHRKTACFAIRCHSGCYG